MSRSPAPALAALVAVLTLLGTACAGDDAAESPTEEAAAAAEEAEAAQPVAIEVALDGDAEVPGPGGDGAGEATVTIADGQVCVAGELTDVDPVTAGHIHEGAADDAGGVVVDLGVTTEGDGAFQSCGDVDDATAQRIIEDPSAFYLNLHNADYPDGVVRGQLG